LEKIFLEQWLHNIIRKKLREDIEFRQWMGREEIPQITRDDIDRYHVFQFRKTIAYASQKSVFYRDLLKNTGIKTDDIRTIKDISKFPFTEPQDIAQNPYHFACVPLGDISHVTTFTSSGTIGPQKKTFFTDKDLEMMTDFMAAGMRTVAVEGDTVQIMLPSSRANDQADLLAQGVGKMGGIPIVPGSGLDAESQLKQIEQSHPAVLFAETSRIWRITQEIYRQHDLRAMGVKIIFVTAEYLSESMRRQLQNIWNCEVHVHYGMTEMGLGVSIECHAHQGYHYNEADLMVEVIDPGTGKVLGEDEEGELVFTAFGREAMPLIRYRVHDISRLISQSCKCGASTLRRIAPVTRRRESIVKIGDDELFPAVFDELLFSIPDIIDYQITLGEDGNRDILFFKIEVDKQDESLKRAINELLLNHPVIRKNIAANTLALSPIELVGQGTLARMNRAKKLILDKRKIPI
jgi:phenylacetate-CoA ligase